MAIFIEPPIPDVIRQIANSDYRRFAWEFFVFFSRFEYALKRVETYLDTEVSYARADWDRFASDHGNLFIPEATPELAAATSYFQEKPPRKQLQQNGGMMWSDPLTFQQNEPFLVWLLRNVRVVRNNLFHGGKFPLIPISDPSRDRELIGSAKTILDACLSLNHQVSHSFFEGINELEP
ncbi:MAG: hypothetical protein WBB69_06730 [Anaerolineales bacterium]